MLKEKNKIKRRLFLSNFKDRREKDAFEGKEANLGAETNETL